MSDPAASSDPVKPLHVAIIMDGNGRWAKRRSMPRVFGHQAGLEATRRVVVAARSQGIGWLTLYAFSTENWNRPASEVAEIMALPARFFETDVGRLHREDVRIRVLGSREGLSAKLCGLIEDAEDRTRHNTGMNLNIAFNYGGQADIVAAARAFAEAVAEGRAEPADLDEAKFANLLATRGTPPPDVIIRPSGEQRLSNFLLWEAAYAEFVFQDVLWPDYDADHLRAALDLYAKRDRRYGALAAEDVLAAG